MIKKWLALLFFVHLAANAGAQNLLVRRSAVQMADTACKGITYSIESGVTFSAGDHSPLWLNANRQGLSSVSRNSAYLAAGIFRQPDKDKCFTYAFGLELAGAGNFTSGFIVQQAYFDLVYGKARLSVGSKELWGELVNRELSTGGLTISGNARPIPQVRLGVWDYLKVPGTDGWISFRGHVAYGRFTDENWQEGFVKPMNRHNSGVLYHSKALYLLLGKRERLPLTFEAGLQMEAQFGGARYMDGEVFKVSTSLNDYLKVLWPTAGGENTHENEQANIEGNQVGSYHFSLNYRLKGWSLRTYYEHYFEDHSMLGFQYPWKDGLIGVEITPPANKLVSGLVYEYLGSKDQSGPVQWAGNDAMPEEVLARDNYYNHYFYCGWQHWGMALGNPLFTSPIYNTNGEIYFFNNRIIAHHLGVSGDPFEGVKYRLLLTHSKNWGTYTEPFPEVVKSTSALVELTFSPRKIRGWSFSVAGGLDRGDLLGDNTGVMVTVRKIGF